LLPHDFTTSGTIEIVPSGKRLLALLGSQRSFLKSSFHPKHPASFSFGTNSFQVVTMGYKIHSNKNGRFELLFIDEPEYCHALMMSPTLKEAKLSDGTWLILLFAVWSAPDLEAIKMAVTLAKKFNGQIQLGVRPFDEHQENWLWCPEIKAAFVSPIWLVFENGRVIVEHVGLRSEEELEKKIQNALESK